MNLSLSTFIPNELFKNKNYKKHAGRFLADPLQPANDIQDQTQRTYKEALVFVDLKQQNNHVNNLEYLPIDHEKVVKWHLLVILLRRNTLDTSGNPRTSNSYSAELYCFENADIHKRDKLLNGNNGTPGSDLRRADSRYNASVLPSKVARQDSQLAL